VGYFSLHKVDGEPLWGRLQDASAMNNGWIGVVELRTTAAGLINVLMPSAWTMILIDIRIRLLLLELMIWLTAFVFGLRQYRQNKY